MNMGWFKGCQGCSGPQACDDINTCPRSKRKRSIKGVSLVPQFHVSSGTDACPRVDCAYSWMSVWWSGGCSKWEVDGGVCAWDRGVGTTPVCLDQTLTTSYFYFSAFSWDDGSLGEDDIQ